MSPGGERTNMGDVTCDRAETVVRECVARGQARGLRVLARGPEPVWDGKAWAPAGPDVDALGTVLLERQPPPHARGLRPTLARALSVTEAWLEDLFDGLAGLRRAQGGDAFELGQRLRAELLGMRSGDARERATTTKNVRTVPSRIDRAEVWDLFVLLVYTQGRAAEHRTPDPVRRALTVVDVLGSYLRRWHELSGEQEELIAAVAGGRDALKTFNDWYLTLPIVVQEPRHS
jgi:hypothetical protein